MTVVDVDVKVHDETEPRQKVAGVRVRDWLSREDEYAMRYGDVVRAMVRGERAAQGKPRHVEVVW